MSKVKEIIVKPISREDSVCFVGNKHCSSLFFGCFFNGELHGVISFGTYLGESIAEGLGLELTRISLDDCLPRNSESFCIGKTIKQIKKLMPQVKWIISFADGCHYGNGVIYRASNFVLTGIKKYSNGCLFRYIYFINKSYKETLTVPVIPFSMLTNALLCGTM